MRKTTRIDAPEAAGFDAIVRDQPAGVMEHGFAVLLAEAAGVQVPRWLEAPDEWRLADAARELGFPLVMKIASPDITHKSDVGGVAVGLKNVDDLRAEYREMLRRVQARRPSAEIEGVTLHRQLKGVELAAGASRDPQFGPTVMVGAGGVHIELYRDVVFRVAPVDMDEALAALDELKAQPLLHGFRGAEPVDRESVAKVLTALSHLMLQCDRVDQVDLNPLICAGNRVAAADLRVVLTA